MPPFALRSSSATLLLAFAGALPIAAQTSPEGPFSPEVAEFVRNFKPGGQDFAGQATPSAAAESAQRLNAAGSYAVQLAASEPVIRQPIDLRFDARGRLWVVQYLQYPFPAGLTVTAYDQYLRANFDRISPPPPRHFRGADKITILEDRDGDGRFETHRDFLDGLNLATSLAHGDGGVWVLQSPYLLFYPDRNGDDIPDGDPEVHLSGFGLEDTHSLASSLHWGPDGWLYGATGSTTTLEIQGQRLLGQGIWRYHPGTRVFEIFAEGGGNTFSLEFDQFGRAFSGTNNGATRGLHYVQGATYVKNWSKHGAAMDPFIFGFFEHMAHEGYSPRFPQAFMVYEAGALRALDGQIVVGMAMTNRIQASQVFPDTSTFRTVDSTALITTDDRAFRPVDIELGPDGAIYVADWADVRLSHLNPRDTWDKSNGRIFRIVPAGATLPRPRDLTQLSSADLIAALADPNRDIRENSRRLLARHPDAVGPVLQRILERNEPAALEAFWVLNLRGELEETQFRAALQHPNEHVRRWAVRLLGDRKLVTPTTARALATLVAQEPALEVLSQLASSARRLPAGQAFPIIRALIARDHASDKHLPLLTWWAIEEKAESGREELLALVKDPQVWQSKLFAAHLAERIGRRFTADQGPRQYYTLRQGVYSDWLIERAPEYLRRNLEFCGRLLESAPHASARLTLLAGMAAGLTGPRVDVVPPELLDTVARLWETQPHTPALITFAARLGHDDAVGEALARMKSGGATEGEQQAYLDLFSDLATREALPLLAELVLTEKNEAKRARRLAALGGFSDPAAAEILMNAYPTLTPRLQNTAQRMLSEKPSWALVMLQAMNAGRFDPGVLSTANLSLIRGHRDARITSALTTYQQKHSDDPAQRYAQQLFETGKTAYTLSCSPCHQENGEGLLGLAPTLIGSRFLAQDDALVRILLHGKENPGRGLIMPPWRQLDDPQLAAVLTFIRREFGNHATPLLPETVTAIRRATSDRERPWTDAELDARNKSAAR